MRYVFMILSVAAPCYLVVGGSDYPRELQAIGVWLSGFFFSYQLFEGGKL